MTRTEADCTGTTGLDQLDPVFQTQAHVLSAMQQAMINISIFLAPNAAGLVLVGKLTPVALSPP